MIGAKVGSLGTPSMAPSLDRNGLRSLRFRVQGKHKVDTIVYALGFWVGGEGNLGAVLENLLRITIRIQLILRILHDTQYHIP